MLYINEADLLGLGVSWPGAIQVIREIVHVLAAGQFSQPVKPYLRYDSDENRIIAMPAYIGGNYTSAGIKWIASFPQNIEKGMPRAHSVTILNDSFTGKPYCIINTSLISAIRTAAVSGFVVEEYLKTKQQENPLTVGILGFGPIGQMHCSMMAALLEERISQLLIYDSRQVDNTRVPEFLRSRLHISNGWKEVYEKSDILITATVSPNGYIEGNPRAGSLLLNVSLRDFKPEIMHFVNRMIVDNWEEVCRQNTDIEAMHKTGLHKDDAYELTAFAERHPFKDLREEDVVMFNPMGMAVFDIGMAKYYYEAAAGRGVGTVLND